MSFDGCRSVQLEFVAFDVGMVEIGSTIYPTSRLLRVAGLTIQGSIAHGSGDVGMLQEPIHACNRHVSP